MFDALLPFLGIVVVLVVVGAVIRVLKAPGGRSSEEYPYVRAELFSAAERSFLGVLDQAVAGRYRVLGKVRLGDIVKVSPGLESGAQSARNRVQSKHVDFVLCEPATMAVEYVVELDDKSHRKSNRQSRDEFVDEALAAAGIRVVHMPAMSSYSVENIRKAFLGNAPAANC